MITSRHLIAGLIALTAMGGFARAVDAAPAPNPNVAPATSSPDLQKLIEQFKSRRDAVLADRQALLNQLKNATEDQKRAILEKMRTRQKDLIDEERALGKQIRDEMRRLRDTVPAAGPGRH